VIVCTSSRSIKVYKKTDESTTVKSYTGVFYLDPFSPFFCKDASPLLTNNYRALFDSIHV